MGPVYKEMLFVMVYLERVRKLLSQAHEPYDTRISSTPCTRQPSKEITNTGPQKKYLSVLRWRLYFSVVFFSAESESGVKSRRLAAYFEHNLKKLSKSRVSVEKLENKIKNIVSIISKILYFYVFWLAESKFVMQKEV